MKCIKCLRKARQEKKPCDDADCRQWIDFPEDLNCALQTIESSGNRPLTLREVAKRLGISFVRVKQIEDKALKKLNLGNPQLLEYLLKDDF